MTRTPLALLLSLTGVLLGGRPARADLGWGACPPPPEGLPDGGLQCATLDVPLDYRDPGGRQIQVAVSRIATARPELRRGVMLFNPGGPGGSGLELPRVFALLLPPEVRDRYDLVGFDPRFVGQSTPISCGLDLLSSIKAFPPIMQPGGFDETVTFMKKVAASCEANAGAHLPFATTANTARDMDRIREALGEEKISYLGYSYGTYLGAVYAALFPQRTDRFVLDSALSPVVWRVPARLFGLGGETRFPDFARFAAARDDIYHLGKTVKQVRATYFRLYEQVERDPIPLGQGLLLDGPLLRAATFSAMYGDDQFPFLAELWRDIAAVGAPPVAATGMLRSLRAVGVLAETPPDNNTAAGLAIVCEDAPWPRSVETYRQELRLDSKLFPIFGPVGSTIWACAFWSHDRVEPPVTIGPDGPANILIVQNLRDPATPFPGALAMRVALGPRARMVSVDQGGHGVYLAAPNVCGNVIPTAFLLSGELPEVDPFCPAEAAPPPAVRLRPAAAADAQLTVDRARQELRRHLR
jgi:pimeloyl-ACP methyl ester carboxylesterase